MIWSKDETDKETDCRTIRASDINCLLTACLGKEEEKVDVAKSLETAYGLIKELTNHLDDISDDATKERVEEINKRMFGMLRAVADYVYEYFPRYRSVKILTGLWKKEAARMRKEEESHLQEKLAVYFCKVDAENQKPCLLKGMLTSTKMFLEEYSQLSTVC